MNYIFFALLSALFLSISDILSKYSLNNGKSSFEYIFWSHGVVYIVCILLLLLILWIKPFNFLLNNKTNNVNEVLNLNLDKTRYAIILSGVFGFLALITIIYTFSISQNIGYTIAIISSTAIFSLIFSYLFLKGNINFIGILGIIFILIGVYLISKCDNSN